MASAVAHLPRDAPQGRLPGEAGPALAEALTKEGLQARRPDQKPLGSIAELKTWLDQAPLLMDGARWFGKGHWFAAVRYDQNGIYTRDSSG